MKDEYSELDYLGYGMDKDDVLNNLLPYRMLELTKFKHADFVVVMMTADEPIILLEQKYDVREFAKEKAEFKLKGPCELISESDIIVNGQNNPPLQFYTFRKK